MWGLISVLKEKGAGGSCKWGCVTPWFSLSVGAVSCPCSPQSLYLVPQPCWLEPPIFTLSPHCGGRARVRGKRRLGLLHHEVVRKPWKKGKQPAAVCAVLGSHLVASATAFPFMQVLELRRPMDSRLEHVDFECLFTCLSVRQLIRIFASLLLERRVIFVADKLR